MTDECEHGVGSVARRCETCCEECGYPEDSFACRIRHINVNVENLRRGH